MRVKWKDMGYNGITILVGQFKGQDGYVGLNPGYACWCMSSYGIPDKIIDRYPVEYPSLRCAKAAAKQILLANLKRKARKETKKRARKA